jgi:hypothetical protein
MPAALNMDATFCHQQFCSRAANTLLQADFNIVRVCLVYVAAWYSRPLYRWSIRCPPART